MRGSAIFLATVAEVAMVLAAALFGMIGPGQAPSIPISLTCQVQEGSVTTITELSLDEAHQRATLATATGRVHSAPALFTPEKVTISQPVGRETVTWTISRVDLSVTQSATFSDIVLRGSCTLKKAPAKRAF